MNRAVEIIKILRKGLESMLGDGGSRSLNCTRIFNFNEKRVSLRMEASEGDSPFVPVGRVDVFEIPTNNGRVTCSCVLTEFESGRSERVILRLKNTQERDKECEKVFGFFRKMLAVPDVKPLDGGFSDSSRGAHHQPSDLSE